MTILLTYDMDEAEQEEEEGSGEVDPELETAEINQVVEISLNSVVGLTTPKTMKLKGTIGEQEVVVLIDSGATHNFISLDLVSKMQIPIVKTGAYGVTMGTGAAVREECLCRGVYSYTGNRYYIGILAAWVGELGCYIRSSVA